MVPRASFGATGHLSSRLIFGAAALSAMSPDRSISTLEIARSAGVNHIDTAAGYGASEDRLQPWLAEHRSEVFLATKTGERSGSAARAELERSLSRMGVDRVDLIQLHNLVEEHEWRTAFSDDGAVAALAAARDEGLCRFIGVTGHGVRIAGMHLRSLDAFPFDSVLFPYSHVQLSRPDYRADAEALLDRCARDDVAVQTIKAVARRRWSERTGQERSWYQPLEEVEAIERAVQFVLAEPRLFLNTSSDARILPAILAAAEKTDGRPDETALAADRDELGMEPLFDGEGLERI